MTKGELLTRLNMPDAFAGWQPVYGTIQGWNGGMEILPGLIATRRPKFIIEVGAWLGLSTVVMGIALKNSGIKDSVILTIDTWLGSLEHWRDEKHLLQLEHGFPTLYPRFLHNVASRHCEDVTVPLPLTSAIAARYLRQLGMHADLIFLDGSHDEKDVYDDLTGYSQLMSDSGIIVGDDFQWEGVANSVKRFCEEQGFSYELTPCEETTYWQIVR